MKKRLVAAGLTAGLLGGGAAGFAFTSGAVTAGAQEGTTTTVVPSKSATARPVKAHRDEKLRETLRPLVDDGTLTQKQLDAVVTKLEAARPMPGPRMRFAARVIGLDTAARTIGVSVADLRSALKDGSSIADVARSKKIDPQKVIDALVSEATARGQKAVSNGRLTQQQADARLETVTERITAMVNGDAPLGPDGPMGRWGRGHGGPPPDGNSAPEASTTTGG